MHYVILFCFTISEHHWLCTSSCESGVVNVMDSMGASLNMNTTTLLQIATLYKPHKKENITVKRLPVQQQRGHTDCGLFAIAFATELCICQQASVENVTFKQGDNI